MGGFGKQSEVILCC